MMSPSDWRPPEDPGSSPQERERERLFAIGDSEEVALQQLLCQLQIFGVARGVCLRQQSGNSAGGISGQAGGHRLLGGGLGGRGQGRDPAKMDYFLVAGTYPSTIVSKLSAQPLSHLHTSIRASYFNPLLSHRLLHELFTLFYVWC